MSFAIPKVYPDSYIWLEKQDPELLPFKDFVACAHDYIRHNVEQGIPADQFVPVEQFVQPGDLQTLSTVVKEWPVKEGAPPVPTMATLLTSIRIVDPSKRNTFARSLDIMVARMRAWAEVAGLNPDNPNESKKERSNRLAAERMRRYRGRIADTDIQDPEEMALVRAVKAAKDNLAAGRAWVKMQEDAAKAAYDAAIGAAKLARAQTVSNAQAHLQVARESVETAERALESYRINK